MLRAHDQAWIICTVDNQGARVRTVHSGCARYIAQARNLQTCVRLVQYMSLLALTEGNAKTVLRVELATCRQILTEYNGKSAEPQEK